MSVGVKAVAFSLVGLALFALSLFVPAGTFNYWQAWLFIAVLATTTAGPSIYWAKRRPEVLRRRMNAGPAAETRTAQKIIVTCIQLWFMSVEVVSALEHRVSWSEGATANVLF